MKVILLPLTALLVFSCNPAKRISSEKKVNTLYPFGCIKIGSNLFIDQNEIDNQSYLEYFGWVTRQYPDSIELISNISPDSSQWTQINPLLYEAEEGYFKDLRFRRYPVVGISKKQAQDYSSWRSDRVMETFLIQAGYLEVDLDSRFSIRSLADGDVKLKKPLPKFVYYPQYRLPTKSEYQLAVDSYRNKSIKSNQFIKCVTALDTSFTKPKIGLCQNRWHNITLRANALYRNELYPLLQSNYGEFLSDEDSLVSRCWFDLKCDSLENIDNEKIPLSGFRNVCQWVKIYVPQPAL
ncbi:MAG: SUMF1/EgtB/PvdO family nonheme iron enzyme [Bacteroidetes bacterium]|nr:SUMF1/EgtB/PvdO family nonheme iron enzyme [Bacteroidota bacterium]